MPITLKQLEAFNAVMTTGSATRAAETLGVSQPAISRMIADFEASVGFPLFQRSSRNILPTPRARTLHIEVERAFLGLQHIELVAAALKERGEGQLRLAVIPSLLPMVVGGLVAPFVAEHPKASLSIEVTPTLNRLDWLTFRDADLGITTDAMSGPGIAVEVIGRTEAICVVSREHRLAALGRPVHACDFAGEAFISYKPDSSYRAEIDRAFAAEGVTTRDLRFEARTTGAICELVAALHAASVIPSPSPQLAADSRLKMLPFKPTLISDVLMVQPSIGPLSPLARAFASFALCRKIDFAADLERPAEPRRPGRLKGRG